MLKENGPRFEMQPYEVIFLFFFHLFEVFLDYYNNDFCLSDHQIRLGTLDQNEAEREWVLHPYMNTSRKRQTL